MAGIEREVAEYEDLSQRFIVQKKDYSRQYQHLYYQRLIMRPMLKEAAVHKWGNSVAYVDKILHLKPGVRCVVLGTIYKEMKLKPNILDEYHAREQYEAAPVERSKYVEDDDAAVLEDDSGRIILTGAFPIHTLVSGVVICVMGHEDEITGEFVVEDTTVADLPKQDQRQAIDTDKHVLLLSGLNVSVDNHAMLETQLLVDYVTGLLGSQTDHLSAASIVRIAKTEETDSFGRGKYKSKAASAASIAHLKEVDDILQQLALSVPVDIMPGQNDPSNHVVPQQPLNAHLFPHASALTTLRGVPNPYECRVDGVRILGTSGQGVDDIYRFSGTEDRLEIMQHTLEWRHLFPTAPDTLGSVPFHDDDPFVIRTSPDVMFAANQPAFAQSLCKGREGQTVRLILVPDFSTSATAVLLNLRTLECSPILFK